METSSSTFDSAIAIESNNLSPRSPPRCNEQARSLNFKLSSALDVCISPEVVARKSSDGDLLYDSEKLKKELLFKADEFFNTGCVKIEPIKNELTIEQVLLRQSDELAANMQLYDQQINKDVVDDDNNDKDSNNIENTTKKSTEKGVSINIDGEFEVLLEHIEGLNTPEIANDMLGLKLCSNFDSSSKAIVVSSLETLAKILNMPAFDPHAPPVKFKLKRALSLHELSHREDNVITIDIPMESVYKYMESKDFNPFNKCLNIFVKHEKAEFCTFCSCPECLSYREVVVHMMMEQFKASHMLVLLLDALLKAYSPLLKNTSAFSHFEKLLEINKDIHWLASGLIYNKKYEELDFIYDESLTDPTILVLFSSILMINSPMQLLQILSFYISCVVEAFAFGIAEVSVEEKLIYILDGFDHLCDISDQIASYFVIFERNFLSKFSLTWLWLCQRLFQQQVYARFFAAITNCGEVLKKDDPLKLRYSEFVKRMLYLDMCWAKFTWPKLQKYNLTEAEAKRRDTMVIVHKLFESLIEDALRLPINDMNDDILEDIQTIKDRRVLWKNILSFAKMQWPEGFFAAPNVSIYDPRCEKCGSLCMEHKRGCKCITCSIGGVPLFQNRDNLCRECSIQDTSCNNANANSKDETENAESVENEIESEHNHFDGCQLEHEKILTNSISNVIQNDFCEIKPADVYHISWAVFKHFTQRKLYVRDKIEEKYFCKDCKFPACMLARRLLNNEMSPALTKILMSHFHPLPMLQLDLRGIFPVVLYFNPRMFASHHESSLHNTVVKAYWTFIISVFGTFFVGADKPGPLNLEALEIDQSDVKVVTEKLKGNIDDSIFLEFLDTIRSSSSSAEAAAAADVIHNVTVKSSEKELAGRKKLDDFLRPTKKGKNVLRISTESIKMPSTAIDTGDINAVTVQPTSSNSMAGCETMDQKRSCTPKSKKCCFEHAADFGAEHCKENHANRKRLKKDCSHARVNETRDRLRKKLQDVRKSQQQLQTQQQLRQTPNHQQQQQQQIKLPPKMSIESNNVEISTLDESIATTASNKDAASIRKPMPPMSPATTTPITGTNTPQSIENVDDSEQVIGKVMEICDMLDNNKQKMKKWLDETLTYIEGYATSTTPTSSANIRKTQPQPKDPKKAAKKAKQKLRKEEEKRIAELHEVRDQFQDIYFKEFLEKIELKSLKKNGSAGSNGPHGGSASNSNLKRRCDKKKIADVEANIKKLQRAKAKLETNILELIATVKQTNTDFKFPYLPTKEQQQAKLKELAAETTKSLSNNEGTTAATPTTMTIAMQQEDDQALVTNGNSASNAYMPAFPKFYPNISFPYEMSFPGGTGNTHAVATTAPPPPYGMASHHALPTTSCYAPPQQQALSPNVMAALAANEKNVGNNSSTDPSKRIVTIRRVHNPNMPDSQVTVTARGGTHGKEKLLYTFVNGTMVPTNVAAAANSNESTITMSNNGQTQQQLSKSQLKKERRRLAKLLSLAQDLAISDCDEDENITISMLPTATETAATLPTKQNSSKNTKDSKDNKKQNKLTKGTSLDSTTSSSQSVKMGKQEKTVGKSTKITKTTSNLMEVTPRKENKDNKTNRKKEKETKANCKLTRKQQEQQNEQNSNDEDSDASRTPLVVEKQMKIQTKRPQEQQQSKQKTNKKREPTTITPSLPPPPPPPAKTEAKTDVAAKQQRQRRLKLINHGQFDNNPYKNLHIQDSDTELDVTASSCDDDDDGNEDQVDDEEPEVVNEAKDSVQVIVEEQTLRKDKKSGKQQKLTATTTTTTQPTIKKTSITTNTVPLPNRSKATQTLTENTTKLQKTQKQQQQQQQHQNKKENNNTIKRQPPSLLEQQKGKQSSATINAQQTYNERSRTHSTTATKNNKHTTLNQNTMQEQRRNKKQDVVSTTGTNNFRNSAATTGNKGSTSRENERTRATKDYHSEKSTTMPTTSSTNRTQRTRKKQQPTMQQNSQHQIHNNNNQHIYNNYTDCGAGIPMRMEYFNPNEVNIPTSQQQRGNANNAYQQQQQQQQQHQMHYENITRQFQDMRIAPPPSSSNANMLPSYASISATTSANISIMDQLNRGVQVENLSLPPGITLTKVDPIKSEQLRLKSESIKRLSQPLQQAPNNGLPTNYAHHHQPHGSTIIAPTPSTSNYNYNAASTFSTAAVPGGSIIMVEGITPKPPAPSSAAIAAAAVAATNQGKASRPRNRRRRKRNGNQNDGSPRDSISTNASSNNDQQQQQTKMVTLRNPMFHAGPAAAAASILQQPNLLAGHHGYAGGNGGLSMTAPLPDQPAAIIKNENGMFTIRNPALHQAVTNGLALGGYRQFGGNVSYYTPQEAVAEAAKAQQQQQQQLQMQQKSQRHANVGLPTESFSYFSNNNVSKTLPTELIAQPQTKKISITCTTIGDAPTQSKMSSESDNIGQGNENPTPSPIARPSSAQRCISAIGSEVKQNRNSANVEHMWSEYRQPPSHDLSQSNENIASISASTGVSNNAQQSSDYFNGYEVFPQRIGNTVGNMHSTPAATATVASSLVRTNLTAPSPSSSTLRHSPNPLFEANVSNNPCHMSSSSLSSHQHHRCGDDSPPPTSLLGYSSTYLDDIPNTGVIRYDDASFLKNLIPGQRLNKEVSIHNINESNFGRPTSPMSHLIEITPVFNVSSGSSGGNNCNKVVSPSPSQQQPHYLHTPSSSSTSASAAGAYSANSLSNYQQSFNEYDQNVAFPSSGSNDNTTASSTGSAEQSYQPFGYDAFDSSASKSTAATRASEQKSINTLFPTNFSTASQRSSPFLDESFVQNLNALQISGGPVEQCAQQQLNGEAILGGNGKNCNATTSSTSASGWW